MRTVLVLVFLFLLPVAVNGMDSDGKYVILDGTSCSDFRKLAQDKRNAEYARVVSWVSGYITATNAISPYTHNILGDFNLAGVMVWLGDFCRKNELLGVADGIGSLMIKLHPYRKRTQ